MLDYSIYEVTRGDYKTFVEQIKPEYREVKTEQVGDTHTATKIYSKKTNKCLCSRVMYSANYGEPEPEKYYIFEMPDNDERRAPIPHYQLKLETKEEVQAFFNFLQEQQKND